MVDLVGRLQRDFFDCGDRLADQALLDQLSTNLSRWQQTLDLADSGDLRMPLKLVRETLLDGLDQSSLNIRFMAGSITFATLMPMRAIPFKLVCLLGLNDGDYPRVQRASDFDLMASDYRPGDRSRRSDDLYLFLEAMLSARHQLYISWVGRSMTDDSSRPPSVLVAQLRDYIDRFWSSDDLARLTKTHPLQAFSASYYLSPTNEAPSRSVFTYDDQWRAAYLGNPETTDNRALAFSAPDEPFHQSCWRNSLRTRSSISSNVGFRCI